MSSNLARCPGGLRDADVMDDMLEVSMYLAAICHDFEHPGLTNDFLVKSHHPLALCYNDRSPLENHHASAAFRVLFQYLNTTDHPVRTLSYVDVAADLRKVRCFMMTLLLQPAVAQALLAHITTI